MKEIAFLTLDDVIGLHSRQLARHGGRDGVLDQNTVQSALAQPQATMLCATVFLGRNGYELACTDDELYDVTMEVANHRMDKAALAGWIRVRLAPAT